MRNGHSRGGWLPPSAFTFVEVVVVLALLGLILGLSTVGLASLQSPRQSAGLRELDSARRAAIVTGKPVRTAKTRAHTTLLFLPDGRAVGPDLDPLTGAPSHAVR